MSDRSVIVRDTNSHCLQVCIGVNDVRIRGAYILRVSCAYPGAYCIRALQYVYCIPVAAVRFPRACACRSILFSAPCVDLSTIVDPLSTSCRLVSSIVDR